VILGSGVLQTFAILLFAFSNNFIVKATAWYLAGVSIAPLEDLLMNRSSSEYNSLAMLSPLSFTLGFILSGFIYMVSWYDVYLLFGFLTFLPLILS